MRQRELEQLCEWMKTPADEPIPPAVSLILWFLFAAGVLGLLIGFAIGGRTAPIVGGILGGIVLAFAGALLLADLRYIIARSRPTPESAVQVFFRFLSSRHFRRALDAVASYDVADQRRANLKKEWKELAPTTLDESISFRLRSLDERAWLDQGLAALRIQLQFQKSTLDWPVPRGASEDIEQVRLLVRRGGRWYLANGGPDDTVDRELIELLQIRKSGSP